MFLRRKILSAIFAPITALSVMSVGSAHASDEVVNIYSYRQPQLIEPLLKAFEAETGIKSNVLFLNKGLVERLAAEGINSPADVIFTVDVGRLAKAKKAGVTQGLKDEAIEASIPVQYRDGEGHWFGVTTRGRVVYASKDRVEQDAITYEELADPKWRGRICVRSGQHDYNIALIASMIAHHGEEKAKQWLEGVRDNLARKPNGNDRAQAKGIFSGECDLGIGNTYYVGLMKTNEKEPEQKEWANAMKVLFPNANERGTHVNISGMALAANAPHKENAIKLMEFLASAKGQEIYADQVFEYPVQPDAKVSDIVASFGDILPDELALEELAKYRTRASELVDETAFNDGPQN